MTKNLLAIPLSALFLAACGGGGDTAPSEPSQPATRAEGGYAGSFKSASFPQGHVQVVVLENDQFWALYGTATAAGDTLVYGMVQGQGKSENGAFSASGRDYFYNGTTVTSSVSARYLTDGSLSGTISAGGQNAAFAVTAAAAAPYSYNTPANLAGIVGNWSGTTLQGGPFSLNIGSNGAYSGTSQGCVMSGNITPRASGKNVFDVSLRFGGTPCGLPNTSGSGIALSIPLANGKTQLIVAGTDAARTFGTAIFFIR